MARTKILVVEDHPIFRKGVIALLKLEQDFEVVAEASDRPQALEAVDAQSPDLALVDLSLGEDNGLDLIKDILHRAPRTRILVLSMHDESLYAERAWAAGALGFCGKGEAVSLLLDAIRTVSKGQTWRSPRALEAKRDCEARDQQMLALHSLSDRELEVFRLMGVGLGTAEIASRLHISVKTVDTYKGNLKGKLACGHTHELRRVAIEWASQERRL